MTRYVTLRLLQAVAVLWAAFTASFAVLYLLPGDPVELAAGATPGTPVDPAAIAEMRARYGLDRPVWQQYWTALEHAVRGDLGRSIGTGQSVTDALGEALPSTLALATVTLTLAVVFGTALALSAAYTEKRWLRGFLTSLPPVGAAAPTFWVGLLLLQLFSFRLRLFPAFGGTGFKGVVLPAITLAVPIGAVIAQVLYSSLSQTWRQPFVEVAFAKGASRRWVQLRHVLRPALAPALTVAGVWVGTVLAGSVVVETVFSRAGIGRLTQTAVLNQDIPVVQGVIVLTALAFVLVNLAVDLVLPLFDPRVVRGNRIGGA
ncbi:ABC transporter permease [Nocardia pseudobrasiliensis]|uniref:Peptide/nickel transport system permease protein n=1 Tax=Nocardia pseudobrasiliensis TaxID=45979 RepID=A0A370I5H4_9NOCA|nr:ABC transporter permease [Nocardia pseudobrasiliensis]RDI65870.1 peptide/nickel transport system permease protein [Nocardia pseudobrasiliensis]